MTKAKVKPKLELTEEEKLIFIETLAAARKNDPAMGWKYLFLLAREALPKDRRISLTIDHPTKLRWIKPMLDKFEFNAQIPAKIKSLEILTQAKEETNALTKNRITYSEEEREQFVRYYYEIKKNFPNYSQKKILQEASKMMPQGRQVGIHMDSLKQIPWSIPLLHRLENSNSSSTLPSKITTEAINNLVSRTSKLTEEQKETFTKIVYESKKAGSTWTDAMKKANDAMPKENRIGENINHASQVPWLKRNLDKLFADTNGRVFINHTNPNPAPRAFPSATVLANVQYIPEGVKGHKTIQHKTFWNDEEKHLFAQYVYEIRITNLGLPWHQVMTEANALMPSHRQKSTIPNSTSQIPWLPKLLDQISKEPKVAQNNEPIIEMTSEPAVQPVMQATPSNMNDMMITMMAAMFKQAMPAIMQDPEAQKKLQAAMLTTPEAMLIPAQPVKPQPQTKKKVIIVGLLPVQANEVQKEFGRMFDMKFVSTNVPSQQIRDSAKNADIAICMTKFVSHSTQNTLRGHAGFNFCNGNTSALRIMLQEKLDRMNGK